MTATHVPVRLDGLASMFPHKVAKTKELYRLGLPGSLVRSWRTPLPGVVLLTDDRPTRATFLRAALRYAEPNAVLTGYDALQLHGIPIPGVDGTIHLLVPFANRIPTTTSLRLERLRRLPEWTVTRGFPVCSVARATLDAARWARGPTELNTLLNLACTYGGVNAGDLWAELEESPQRGRPAVRTAIKCLDIKVLDLTRARARRVLALSGLPQPTWRRQITADGQLLGLADAWWDELAVAWRWLDNPRPEGPDPLAAAGVRVVRTVVARLAGEPQVVAEELRSAHALARLGSRPAVIAS